LSVVLLAIILDRITESFGRAPGTAKAPLFSGLKQLFRAKVTPAQA
ncbi:choline ABC transporter permease subunit, partial [Burkholderia sp. Bp9143]